MRIGHGKETANRLGEGSAGAVPARRQAENTMLNGRPMWMSYLAEAKAVLEAIGWKEDGEPEGNA